MSDPAGYDAASAAMDAMLEVARRLGRSFELAEVLHQVIETSRAALRSDRGSVFLLDAAKGELYTKVATGDHEIRVPLEKGIVGQCASTRSIINIPDCYADPRFNTKVDLATGYRTRCLIALPLIGLDDEVVGVMELMNPVKGRFDAADERFAEALATQAAIAIQKVQWIQDRVVKAKMEQDLDLARRVQQSTLPTTLPLIAGYELAAMTRPADETGGDVYDVMTMPAPAPAPGSAPEAPGKGEETLILLADVAGHGIGPALTAMSLGAMVRMGVRLGATLDELLMQVAEQVERDLPPGRFITMFLGTLDPVNHRLVYHSAGQGPLVVYDAAKNEVELRRASTLPLGILPGGANAKEGLHFIDFKPGDVLLLLSDGFFEYHDLERRLWGYDAPGELVKKRPGATAEELLQTLVEEVAKFGDGGPQSDDLTGIVLKRVVG